MTQLALPHAGVNENRARVPDINGASARSGSPLTALALRDPGRYGAQGGADGPRPGAPPALTGCYRVWVDGAASGGPGGIAYLAHRLDTGEATEASLSLKRATNQQAEVLAAAYALHQIPPALEIDIVSDSQYLVRGISEWLMGWIGRGWRTSSGSQVANRAYWLRLLDEIPRHGRVGFEWVKGHNGDPGNERVDELAVAARKAAH